MRQDLEDMPQVSLEPLELGDHRNETAPQVEVRVQFSRNVILRRVVKPSQIMSNAVSELFARAA